MSLKKPQIQTQTCVSFRDSDKWYVFIFVVLTYKRVSPSTKAKFKSKPNAFPKTPKNTPRAPRNSRKHQFQEISYLLDDLKISPDVSANNSLRNSFNRDFSPSHEAYYGLPDKFDTPDSRGFTPLIRAIMRCDVEKTQFYVAAKCDVNRKDQKNRRSPLMWAYISKTKPSIQDLLIKNGADVNQIGNFLPIPFSNHSQTLLYLVNHPSPSNFERKRKVHDTFLKKKKKKKKKKIITD
eukprot:TRINITY_DN14983_c0_g1_i2.p1 TRINITY_DN14983_c0_g1~~TRINITY_DN14983_c0_g1_i2.p1  ORF type:complete len:237 (+),score=39.79 TRINITY_DN14983_c0_g1_i2:86-796(+)